MKWIIALLLIPTALFSQKVKKINNKVTREKYYVLKSDTSVRHGRYEKYKYNDYLLVSGYYKNGKKDSIWNEYSEYSLELIANGNYVNDEKVGIWKYPQSGVLEYDHTVNKPLSYDSTFNANFCDNAKRDTIPVIYVGGSLAEGICQNLEYPEDEFNNSIQGIVRLKITIDEQGKIKTIEILQSLTPATDKAAIKAISSLKNQWIPALRKSDGQPVEYVIIIPISFSIIDDTR